MLKKLHFQSWTLLDHTHKKLKRTLVESDDANHALNSSANTSDKQRTNNALTNDGVRKFLLLSAAGKVCCGIC